MLVLANVLWSLNYATTKLGFEDWNPMLFSASRFLLAGVAFSAFVVWREGSLAIRRQDVPLVVAAAAVGGWLVWERSNPSSVRASVLDSTREAVQALYAYDYRDSDGSVQGKLAVLTGDLRDQYAKDLEAGSIDAYEQVSATTRYEIDDIGLKRINEAQDSATVLVFGRYVVDSVSSGEKDAPEGWACEVTPEGAQACTQILRLDVVDTDDGWKIEDYAILASGA